MSSAVATSFPTLSCMLLPMNGYDILVPKSIVKEVVFSPSIRLSEDKNDWLLGEIQGGEKLVPFVSIEQLCELPRDVDATHNRAVLCHALVSHDRYDCYALKVDAIPRPLIIDSRALYESEDAENTSEVISHYVNIGSKKLAIPDFQKLEATIYKKIV